VDDQRFNRAGSEHVDEGEAHIGRAQILHDHRRQRERQPLSAERFGASERAPAICHKCVIGCPETFRHGDDTIVPSCPDRVAQAQEGSIFPLGERGGALHDRIHHVLAGCREARIGTDFGNTRDMVEQKTLFSDGGGIGHENPSPKSHSLGRSQ